MKLHELRTIVNDPKLDPYMDVITYDKGFECNVKIDQIQIGHFVSSDCYFIAQHEFEDCIDKEDDHSINAICLTSLTT
jgi:hypothetical protein